MIPSWISTSPPVNDLQRFICRLADESFPMSPCHVRVIRTRCNQKPITNSHESRMLSALFGLSISSAVAQSRQSGQCVNTMRSDARPWRRDVERELLTRALSSDTNMSGDRGVRVNRRCPACRPCDAGALARATRKPPSMWMNRAGSRGRLVPASGAREGRVGIVGDFVTGRSRVRVARIAETKRGRGGRRAGPPGPKNRDGTGDRGVPNPGSGRN